MVDAPQMARQRQSRAVRLAIGLAALIVLLIGAGAVYTINAGRTAPPALPPVPLGARQLWASQTADMLEANQIVSVALYRTAEAPGKAIAFYLRGPGGAADATGRFRTIIHSGSASALPSDLQHLPAAFVDGKGAGATADYTYTEYSSSQGDVGVAVDLRHPNGPTLIFTEMLSS